MQFAIQAGLFNRGAKNEENHPNQPNLYGAPAFVHPPLGSSAKTEHLDSLGG
jgi:hypothetical protein